MTILTGFYFHLDFTVSETAKVDAKTYYENLIQNISNNLYHQETNIHVELVDGSLKFWVSIAGAIYLTIGQYGSFRAGINQMIDDSKIIKSIILNDLKKNGVNKDQIKTQKRLMGTPDRIRRLLLRIERYENNSNNLSEDQRKKEIQGIIKNVSKLTAELKFKNDYELFLSSLQRSYKPNPKEFPMVNRRIYMRKEIEIPTLQSPSTAVVSLLEPPFSESSANSYIKRDLSLQTHGFIPWLNKGIK